MSSRHDEDQRGEGRFSNFTPGDVALFKDIADAAAEATAQRMFVMMGHDPKDPRSAQLDAAWNRRWRERTDGMTGKAILTLVGVAVLGGVKTLWAGLQTALPH